MRCDLKALQAMSRRFGADVRLKARAEFLAVQETGSRVATRHIVLLARPNDRDRDRLGVIASRKFGGSVARNLAKRRLREAFRQLEPDQVGARGLAGLDLVAIPRRDMLAAPAAVVHADFAAALTKLRGRGARS